MSHPLPFHLFSFLIVTRCDSELQPVEGFQLFEEGLLNGYW
jgi:hypothetical protein